MTSRSGEGRGDRPTRAGGGLERPAPESGDSPRPAHPPDPRERRPDAPAFSSPEWARSATLYQLNTRQLTGDGTFAAAEEHLPRIRGLGVDIVWLMPIHPIGRERRKGTLGSPYSVRDHHAVNPELGTLDDLRSLVDRAHGLGMRVILDWVANHTAWDHPLVTEHPEWYARDWKGDFRPTPWWDWTDVIDLDFGVPEVHDYMVEAMTYWVTEVGVDGYRCDVAGFVPMEFWRRARRELEAVRPVFLLAEWESRDLHRAAFDATYAWSWADALQRIAAGQADVSGLARYYSWNESAYPRGAMRMTHVSNHDQNSWEGTPFERFGDALEPAIVLSVVGEGIPLLYSGQEAGNRRRLAFFDRDPIAWREHPVGDLYRRLFALKHRTPALHNGAWGARMIRVPNTDPSRVLSFVRRDTGSAVFAVFNFSPEARTVSFADSLHHGPWQEALEGGAGRMAAGHLDLLEGGPGQMPAGPPDLRRADLGLGRGGKRARDGTGAGRAGGLSAATGAEGTADTAKAPGSGSTGRTVEGVRDGGAAGTSGRAGDRGADPHGDARGGTVFDAGTELSLGPWGYRVWVRGSEGL